MISSSKSIITSAAGDIDADVTSSGGLNRLAVQAAITSFIGVDFPHINRTDVSQVITSSGNSSTFDTAGFGMINTQIAISAVSGTNPTIQILHQFSDDGTNWSTSIKTNRYTATGTQRFMGFRAAGKYYRYSWLVTGTTPSFTVAIITTLKAFAPKRHVVLCHYSDLDITTVGNVSTVFEAGDVENISIAVRRGADSGSVNFRVQVSLNGTDYDDLTGNVALAASSVVLLNYSGYAYLYYRIRINDGAGGTNKFADICWSGNS